MERERGKSQTDMPARANHHQHAAQFATAVSNWRSAMANRRSYMLGIIASVQIEGGHLDAAVSSLEGALTTSRTLGIAFYDAEISRLQDRCLLTEGKARGETAEERYKLALDLARKQGARSFGCGAPPTSRGSGATRASRSKLANCSLRSTVGSPKGLTRSI